MGSAQVTEKHLIMRPRGTIGAVTSDTDIDWRQIDALQNIKWSFESKKAEPAGMLSYYVEWAY